MSTDRDRRKSWKLLPPSTSFMRHFEVHKHHTKYIQEFEQDVTTDPYRHQVRKRIAPLNPKTRRYKPGSYRWRKSDLRIVYYPDKDDHTVFPLDASTAGNIRYKKKG